MSLSKPAKLAVIGATILMPLYLVFFMAEIFLSTGNRAGKSLIFEHFELFFIVHGLMMLLQFALIAFYIVYLFKTSRVAPGQKALWAIVLFMGGPIAMPIFWYLHIWREPQVAVG